MTLNYGTLTRLMINTKYLTTARKFTSLQQFESLQFIPPHKETQKEDVEKLKEFVSQSTHLLVLTGAGG